VEARRPISELPNNSSKTPLDDNEVISLTTYLKRLCMNDPELVSRTKRLADETPSIEEAELAATFEYESSDGGFEWCVDEVDPDKFEHVETQATRGWVQEFAGARAQATGGWVQDFVCEESDSCVEYLVLATSSTPCNLVASTKATACYKTRIHKSQGHERSS
jgi:hypothetical protein